MRRTANRAAASFLAIGCLLVWLGVAASQATTEKPANEQLHDLLVERRDVMKDRLELVKQLFSKTRTDYEEVLAATDDLLACELELASTSAERVEVLQNRLNVAQELESTVETRVRAALVSTAELYAAKAARLQAEIDLLR